MDYYLDTLSNIKTNYLNWEMSATEDDEKIKSLMLAISKLFQSSCGSPFIKMAYTEYFDTKRAGMMVPNYNSMGLQAYSVDAGYQVLLVKNKPIDESVPVTVYSLS